MRELEAENPEEFRAYMRLESAMYRKILDRIESILYTYTHNI